MERLKCCSILLVCLVNLSLVCNGEDEAPMKGNEKEALYSAIQGFVGKWWNGSDLYPDPCGWTPIQGVSCDLFDGYWYVTDLSIGPVHDNSLSCAENVEFAHQLFELRHLRTLSFFNCFVSPLHHPVSIPTQNWHVLGGILLSLEFRSNPGLIGSVPDTFGELRNLQSLVLMENGLTGELPESIGSLMNLRRLNLARNSFNGRIPGSFGGLSNLLILDMSSNSLSGFLPGSFGGLTSLLKLDLSHNQLEGKIPEEIGKLKNLTLLDLSNNRLSNGLTKSLRELQSLQELALSNNPTGGDIMSIEWQNLRSLTALDLSNMSLTGGIPDSFSVLDGLRFLGLNGNKLTGNIPTKLSNLPNISAMYIHGNNLTGQLPFSSKFYTTMGPRFRAWGNPNLCYPIGTGYPPSGVKSCAQEVTRHDLEIGHESKMENLGVRVSGGNVNGLVVLIEVLIVLSLRV